MFQSYDDKFRSIVRRNAVDSVRRARFERWWKDNLTGGEAIGDHDKIKQFAWNAYEQGVWDGADEEMDLSGEFEEAVQAEFDQLWAEALAYNKKREA